MGRHVEKTCDTWFDRLVNQFHPGFLGSPPRLVTVAGHTGADNVFPRMRSVTVTRHHVVQRKVPRLFSAILAGIMVPLEDFKACQPSYRAWRTPYHCGKPYDSRNREITAYRVNIAGPVFYQFCFTLINQHDCTANPANVKRFITLIQYKDRKVYHLWAIFLQELLLILLKIVTWCKLFFNLSLTLASTCRP